MKQTSQTKRPNLLERITQLQTQDNEGHLIVGIFFLCALIDFGKNHFANYVYPKVEGVNNLDDWWDLWFILNALFYPLIYFLSYLAISRKFIFLKLLIRSAAGLGVADFIDRCIGDGSTFTDFDKAALLFIFIDVLIYLFKKQGK